MAGAMSLAAADIDERAPGVRTPDPSRVSLEITTTDDGVLTPRVLIENVRLEPPRPPEPAPSSLLKFDVVNYGTNSITDVVLEVSVVQQLADKIHDPPVVVHPFKMRASLIFDPGQAISYELLLRNLSVDCDCIPTVKVLSVRPVVAP
jgi:hypothetical protein